MLLQNLKHSYSFTVSMVKIRALQVTPMAVVLIQEPREMK